MQGDVLEQDALYLRTMNKSADATPIVDAVESVPQVFDFYIYRITIKNSAKDKQSGLNDES